MKDNVKGILGHSMAIGDSPKRLLADTDYFVLLF